ncbi:RNA polymerase sigma factor [Janibacter sp. GXQ6167]|uniref:RNA polymerase sigma factor n=1 Tax=Janibacter sp. GXQ6167 TaxID=3240791 RepID=UPI003524F3BE
MSTATGLAARLADAFTAYLEGDDAAFATLIEAATPLLWHTARCQGVDHATAEDIVQGTWVSLWQRADTIHEPTAVLQWLLVSTRRSAWRARHGARRDAPTRLQPEDLLDPIDPAPSPLDTVVAAETDSVVLRHLAQLSHRCQELLRLVALADRPDYRSIAAALDMPVGSIGPTRGRCLAKLRSSLAADPTWGESA